MKLAPHTRKLPALSCAAVLSLLFGAAACGEEAPLPTGMAGTGSVVPNGGTAGTGAEAGTGTTPMAGTGTGGTGT
ncbi:MAG: hypothetical protein K0R38_6294, partial [Polyangiaceae bacterium]|nr:hypothetical protein [Polyangiaceae bacterium]